MSRHTLLILSLIIFLLISTPASAQDPTPPPDDKPTHSGTVTRTNGIYDIFVEDVTSRIGTYTVRTGVNHPVTSIAGSPQNVLFGGTAGSPATSFNTNDHILRIRIMSLDQATHQIFLLLI